MTAPQAPLSAQRFPIPISFELYPPKTDKQREIMNKAMKRLMAYSPEYASVTFGAGGSTQHATPETVYAVRDAFHIDTAPHISCVGSSQTELKALLDDYHSQGVTRLVVLRGDTPSGLASGGDFNYASDLVTFIRTHYGDHFTIKVGCHPECHPNSSDSLTDLHHFKLKMDAGADAAITQYFYNADAYFRFRDEAIKLGVDKPIIPGIMPIADFTQLQRFSNMCGADIPRWIERRMAGYANDPDAVRAFGAEVVGNLCRQLIDGGAPAFHFYTLNRSVATKRILQQFQ